MTKQKIAYASLPLVVFFSLTNTLNAQVPPVLRGTVEIPKCLVFRGTVSTKDAYVPCTGVVPIDPIGNPSSWDVISKGSVDSPGYDSVVTNGSVVSSSNPLPVTDIFTSGIFGSTAPTRGSMIGGRDSIGNIRPFLTDTSGTLQVNCPSCSGGGGGGGSNSASSTIGTESPTYASYTGYLVFVRYQPTTILRHIRGRV